jgi:hypothetical protein
LSFFTDLARQLAPNNGWRMFNRIDEQITNQPTDYNIDSRLDIIEAETQDWKKMEASLLECIETF